MGCYPLGNMVSRALGRKRHRQSSRTTTIVYSPPPSYSYARSMARSTVTFNEHPEIIMVPSEPTQSPTVTKHHHHVHADLVDVEVRSPSPQPEVVQQPAPPGPQPSHARSAAVEPDHRHGAVPRPRKMPEPSRVRFAPEPAPYPVRKEPVQVRFGVGAHCGPSHQESAPASSAYPAGSGYSRYMMSPLPDDGDRRRREYFSGEYHYYPTPVREGIYRIATDANRLSTIFSEENPNACSIV